MNPELLHVNSAVFEEGSMPKVVFSSKPVFKNKVNNVIPAQVLVPSQTQDESIAISNFQKSG